MTVSNIEQLLPKEHRTLIFEFFVVFSRFEYALKRSGFITGNDRQVSANWDEFASKYNSTFDPERSDAVRQACAYFKECPPCKQILTDGSLEWSEPRSLSNEPLLTWLLTVVRIVRNNLFHGGKFPIAPIEEPTRNPLLLSHALTIINACLSLDYEVRDHFSMEE
jgi:hypothetical protein